MKKIFAVLALVLVSAVGATAQTDIEKTLMAMEKQAWDAYGKGDGKFFETFLADEAMSGNDSGFSTKAQTIKGITAKPCEMKSYAFSNFKAMMIDTNTALVTYEAAQDITCGGKKEPDKVISSAIYVKRKGKWQNIFYQERVAQPMPAQ